MTFAEKSLRVLNVEDRRHDTELLAHELSNSGYLAQWQRVDTETDFLSALESEPDIILADYALPRFSGLRALELLKKSDRDIPFILVSGTLGEDEAVEAMRMGADDYLLKDRILRLGPAISAALERKRARAEVRRLELDRLREGEIHRQIFEQAACGIGIVSLDWRYKAVNDTLCRMLGRNREELLGMSVADVTYPDDVAVSASLRDALLGGGQVTVQPLEKRYQRPDGTIVWAEVTASLVASPVSGEESHLVATMLDISVRKSAEQAREASRQFAQSTIDSLAQPICVIDEAGTILAVNRAWPRISNLEGSYLAHAVLGANYLDTCELAKGADLAPAREFAAGIRKVISGSREFFTLEYAVQTKDVKRWLRSRVTRFHAADPVRTTIVHTDVTSRVRALNNLRESETRFRGTFEQAAVGIAHISLEGCFVLVNSKLCTIFGYAREAFSNMRFLDLMVPDDRAGYLKSRAGILAGEQDTDACERRFVREDGEIIWINLVTSIQRASGGEPRYFVSVFEEISSRKLAEFRLHRLNRLHSVLSSVGDTIVRTRERQQLFDATCRIVVNQGQLRMAYIGIVDDEARVVRPAAYWGQGLEYVRQPTSIIPMDGGPLGQGTLGTALRTGAHDYCNNIAQTDRMQPWHEATARNGLLSNASFPLFLRGSIVAVLVMYAGEVDYFLDDELRLMDAVASSLSFALETLALEDERRIADELMHRQQSELRALFDLVPAMLCIKNTENGFLRVNRRLADTLGKSVEEVEGKSAFDLFPTQAKKYFADDLEVIRTGQPKLGIVERLNGSPSGDLWVQTDKIPYSDAQGKVIGLIAMVRDITESRQAELRLKFLNRVYAVLSGINTLIVRVTNLDDLFTGACTIAVEKGGFRMAYFGIVDREEMCVRVVASAGADSGYIDEVRERMSLRENARLGHGPAVTAALSQRPVIINDVHSDPRIRLKKVLTKRGIHSILSIPLTVEGKVYAVFTLHAGETGFFDDDEVRLLTELGDDIAFAIANIEIQKRLEYLKEESERFARATIDSLSQLLCVIDEAGTILTVNKAWAESEGASGAIFQSLGPGANYIEACENSQLINADSAHAIAIGVRSVIEGEQDTFSLEYASCSNNTEIWYLCKVTRFHGEGPVRVTIAHSDITTRVLAQSKLAESEARFRSTFEQAAVGIALVSANGRFVRVNDKLCAILGFARDELIGTRYTDLMTPEDRLEHSKTHDALLSGEMKSYSTEGRFFQKSGDVAWINLVSNLERKPTGSAEHSVTVFQDITVRKQAEGKLRRLNRLHTVLSKVGEVIVRTHERAVLFDAVCRILVDDGLLRMSYVAGVDETSRQAMPISSYGVGLEYLDESVSKIPTDDGPLSQGTVGTVLRTGRHDYCNDIANAARMKPWHVSARKRGFKANAAFPLRQNGAIIAVLEMYAAEVDYFQDDEIRLMDSVAEAVSFALDAQVLEQERSAAQIELQTLFDLIPAMICFKDTKNVFLRVNKRLSENAGLSVAEMEGKSASEIFPVEAEKYFADDLEVIQSGVPKTGIVEVLRSIDGVENWVRTDKVPYRDHRGDIIGVVVMIQDITDQRHAENKIRYLNRVHSVLSGINTLIVRARDRATLFNEACQIAVEEGGFKMAVLGTVDSKAMLINIVASAGADSDHIAELQSRMSLRDDAPLGHNPAVLAVRKKTSIVINDSANDERVFLQEAHRLRGIRSMVSLPIIASEVVVATFNLYAAEEGFFDDAEMQLLHELAGDIAFAIENLAKQQRLAYLKRVNDLQRGIAGLIVRARDRNELFRDTCQVAIDIGGFGMAMIGIMNVETGKLITLGLSCVTKEALEFTQSVLPPGGVPPNLMVRQALADKKPVVANDSQNDPRVAHRQQHVQFSTFSMAILPLVIADTAVGVFALYSREKEFFHDEEMKLLTDVTGDIAFAVDHLEKQARLDYLAYYDVLTELANRTLFVERLNLHLRGVAGHGKKIALFVIDLERFRNFNDSLGRSEGDALLKHVAHFLTRHFGDASLVARIGGDQFAVAIPELLDSESIDVLADKLLAAVLKSPFIKDEIEHRFSVKVGGAQLPGDGNTAEKALQNAEAALKKAKAMGEKFLTFASSMTAAVSTRLNLENRLRKAVDQDEFVLHYQPKIELLNGKLAGVEALIRWNDPQTGLVPPGQFIPVLEETGLMYEVGRWVIQKAIADFISWRAKGLRPVRIAVNVSPLQLRKRDFVADVESRIRLEPLAADGLELEITESMIMEDVHNTIDKLKAICALGVHIAIDDFGTGYSSLSYLSKLPVNTLKIDRSFVHEMTNSAQGMALVSTIINLARSLRLKVVAEGVETDQQAQMLRLLGCDEVQGFLYSKPVPSEVFESNFLNGTA